MPLKFYDPKNDEFIETEDQETEENYAKGEAMGLQAVADITHVDTGETNTISRKELKQALDSGKFVIPELYQARKEEQEVKSEVGPATAAGLGFAKFATAGAAPAVGGIYKKLSGGTYEQGRKEYEQRQNAAWEQHPVQYGLGATAGILPGIAAKGITTAGQIALGAVTPLVEEATKLDEPITAERAKQQAASVGMGAALGGLGALGQAKAPAIAKGAGEMAERRAVKAIGADVLRPQRRIERMPGGRQKFGRDLLESGIVTAGKTVTGMKNKAEEIALASGQAIGSTMKRFDEMIGAPSVNRQSLVGEIEEIPIKIAESPAKVSLAKRINSEFVDNMKKWAEEADSATLEEVWKIRKDLDDLAYTPTGIDKPLHKELQKIRNVIEKRLHATAINAGINPAEIAAYDKAKRMYQVSKEAALTGTEKANRMNANRAISLTDYLSGGAGATVGTAGGGKAGGVAGAILGAIGNKISRQRGPQVAAATLDTLSKMMKNDPERFNAIISTFVKTGAIKIGEE